MAKMEFNETVYVCIDTSFGDLKLEGKAYTIRKYTSRNYNRYIDIYDGNKSIGLKILPSTQNFEDYFIPLVEWREQQIDSILNE